MSSTEMEVLRLLHDSAVSTLDSLSDSVGVSKRTIRRALRRVGYYSSINQGSSWVTLRETPRFNVEGLWLREGACFSSHGSLIDTVEALIERSDEGRLVAELEEQVRTRVHQAVGVCLRARRIGRFYWGRNAVYVSAKKEVAASQEARRRERLEAAARRQLMAKRAAGVLPEGLEALTIIRLLVQMLVSPEASVASLSKTLQAQHLDIDAERIRRVMDFYERPRKKGVP